SQLPILVDYESESITIFEGSDFTPPEGGDEIEFFLTSSVPTIRAKLLSVEGDFLVDLGNAFGLIVHEQFVRSSSLTEHLQDFRDLGSSVGGIGGTLAGQSAFAESFEFGNIRIDSLRVILPAAADGLSGSQELAGNIGNRILEDFSIIFDYAGSRIIFYPADNSQVEQ
ncbi:MAG: hypothetical protein V3T31_11485, partial [candidate division Zixibacteria bacterium]